MTLDPARMTLRWTVPDVETPRIGAALQAILLTTWAEPGCSKCALCIDAHNPSKIQIEYVEEWNTQNDLNWRLLSNQFSSLTELMERASDPPTIIFNLPGGISGADYAQQIRDPERLLGSFQ